MIHLKEKLGGRIELDGNKFQDCVFEDGTVLIFRGGEPPEITNCTSGGFKILFEDSAKRTLQFIRRMHEAGGSYRGVISHFLSQMLKEKDDVFDDDTID